MDGYVIYKYIIQITDVQTIEVPIEHKLLDIQFQQDNLCAWVLVLPSEKTVDFKLRIIGTGNKTDIEFLEEYKYLKTVQMLNGAMVWHIFLDD